MATHEALQAPTTGGDYGMKVIESQLDSLESEKLHCDHILDNSNLMKTRNAIAVELGR